MDDQADNPTRRGFMGRLTGLLPVLGSPTPSPSEPAPPTDFYWHIGQPGWYELGDDGTMRLVPRWELPFVTDGPQPEPSQVHLDRCTSMQVLYRYWEHPPEKCRLCRTCRVNRSEDGWPNSSHRYLCTQTVPHAVTLNEAPLWSERSGHEGGGR